MNKNEIRVLIDTPEKAKAAYEILTEAKERIYPPTKERLERARIESYSYIQYTDNMWSGTNICKKSVISIEELANLLNVKTEQMEKPYNVSRAALKEIYNSVCSTWQAKIVVLLGENGNLFSNEIEVSESIVNQAYIEAGCTTNPNTIQLAWLNKYTPKRKKMVKKTIEVYTNIYKNLSQSTLYSTQDEALMKACNNNLPRGVKLTGEYEIEE